MSTATMLEMSSIVAGRMVIVDGILVGMLEERIMDLE